jgi:hypothetical protein
MWETQAMIWTNELPSQTELVTLYAEKVFRVVWASVGVENL